MLPVDEVEALFSNLGRRSTDSNAVGVVCPKCKRVRMYALENRRGGLFRQDASRLMEPAVEIVTRCAAMMRCEDEACSLSLLLVIPVNRDISEKAYRAHRSKWDFSELVCPDGHPIVKPTDW